MTPAELSRTVRHAVCRAVEDGALRVNVPENVKVERTRPGGRGDWASNIALRLAREAGQPAVRVAGVLRERIAAEAAGRAGVIESVEVTGPGFLNFTLAGCAQQRLLATVREHGEAYGRPAAPGGPFAHADEVRARVWAEALVALGAAGEREGRAGGRPGEAAPPGLAPTPAEAPAPAAPPTPVDRSRPGARPAPAAPPTLVARPRRGARPAPTPTPPPTTPAPLPTTLGTDATRWALLAAAAHDRPRTQGLLVQHERNPLFRVRYAYARTRALTRAAAALGFESAPEVYVDAPALTAAVADHPAQVEAAARLHAPDRIARHLEATADALLAFQHTVLPLGDEKPSAAHRSRLALAEAAGTVLAGGLSLLGISAPEHL